ncbi:hypothetical protein ACG04R_23365 [Roseateles sp. BYS78W]|uniref:Uncharacterized protein n=1 Tax=Pelomonas candidula TaxID=3299025 RepID=A0ABW7HI93_9BURK
MRLAQLDQLAVASVYGGATPAQRHADVRLMPLQPVFRVRLEDDDLDRAPAVEVGGRRGAGGRATLAGRGRLAPA